MMPHCLDTNILLYSISQNPAESLKRDLLALLDDDLGALSSRSGRNSKFRPHASGANAVPHDLAAGQIGAGSRFRIQAMTLRVLNIALRIRKIHGFAYWDSAIVAAALALGCDRVYTEDLTYGRVVEGLVVIDPFR